MSLAAIIRTALYAHRCAKHPNEAGEIEKVRKYYPGGQRQFLRDYK